MNEVTTFFISWGASILYAVIFCIIGYVALIKRRGISTSSTCWFLFLFFVIRIADIGTRAYASFSRLTNEHGFGKYFADTAFLNTLERVVYRDVSVIAIAFVIWLLLFWYARKTKYEKIDVSDVNIFAFGVLVSGWPNFFIYLGLVFLTAALGLIAIKVLRKETQRMVVTPYFVFAGLVTIFFGWELSKIIGLYALR